MVNCAYKTEESQCQHKSVHTTNQVVNDKICTACKLRCDIIDPEKLRKSLPPKITVAGPEIQGPGLVQMAQNFGAAMIKQGAATLKGEETFVPKEIYEKRLEICRGCEYFHKGRCLNKSCGCFLNAKARLSTSACPLDPPKWTEWQPTGVISE